MFNFKKAALLVEGAKDIFHAKTAVSILRYQPEKVAYLIDSTQAGKTASELFNTGGNIPVVSGIENSDPNIDALIICLMLPEGVIPQNWLNEIIFALKQGISIINPLHINIAGLKGVADSLGGLSTESTEKISKFNNTNAEIHNVRIPPDDLELFTLEVLKTKAKRILTVGSDCNIGKMLTTIELNKAAEKAGYNSGFIATGQISTILKGSGIAVDRVISDFLPAAVERLIMEEKERDVLFVEGQGSIFQPLYSAVTLGLIHGSAPNALVFCHVPSRQKLRYTDINIPDLNFMIRMHEEMTSFITPCKVTGISLNCYDKTDEEALNIIKSIEDKTGLPATDPIKFGIEKIFLPLKQII